MQDASDSDEITSELLIKIGCSFAKEVYDGGKEEDRNHGSLTEKVRGLKKAKIIGEGNLAIRKKDYLWKIEEVAL